MQDVILKFGNLKKNNRDHKIPKQGKGTGM